MFAQMVSNAPQLRRTTMSTGNGKRQRRRATRVRRVSEAAPSDEAVSPAEVDPTDESARDHYRREKERRAARERPPEHPLEQARRAYHALLAADAERAKGGRPKKTAAGASKKSPQGVGEAEANKDASEER
jgi:hypothetical protein